MEQSKQSLAQLRVLVTRAEHQSTSFADKLRSLGASVIEMPLLRITPPAAWQKVDEAIANLHRYSWLIFASANAADHFFNRAAQQGSSLPAGISIAAVGPATAAAVLAHGHQIRYQPSTFTALTFVQNFPDVDRLEGARILCPQGDTARQIIAAGLTDAGALVDTVICYRVQLPADAQSVSIRLQQLLRDKGIDVLTLASSQTARNLQQLAQMNADEQSRLAELLHAIATVTIGPETTATVRALGFQRIEQADPHTSDGMVAVVTRLSAQISDR
jgi:uroporphyrinogen III methyltransferase/synthase